MKEVNEFTKFNYKGNTITIVEMLNQHGNNIRNWVLNGGNINSWEEFEKKFILSLENETK